MGSWVSNMVFYHWIISSFQILTTNIVVRVALHLCFHAFYSSGNSNREASNSFEGNNWGSWVINMVFYHWIICCDINHDSLEATWIEIFLPKTKPILCASLYRPPKQSDFYNILDGVCSSCKHFTKLTQFYLKISTLMYYL